MICQQSHQLSMHEMNSRFHSNTPRIITSNRCQRHTLLHQPTTTTTAATTKHPLHNPQPQSPSPTPLHAPFLPLPPHRRISPLPFLISPFSNRNVPRRYSTQGRPTHILSCLLTRGGIACPIFVWLSLPRISGNVHHRWESVCIA